MRLQELVNEVAARFPSARFGPITDMTEIAVSSIEFEFPQGIRLCLFNDLDVPSMLFEILRISAREPLPFEHWADGEARRDKLPSQAALDLIGEYSRVQEVPTPSSHSSHS